LCQIEFYKIICTLNMGNIESTQSPTERIKVNIKPRQFKNVKLKIPYKQLEMIKTLQMLYKFEVKGTLHFDQSLKFKGFEIRTDNSEIFSSGSSDWRIAFHTHPDKTAEKYGLRYYSPPSVDDVMEIYDHSMQYVPNTIPQKLGEISIVFTNEGLYIMQANRLLFTKAELDKMSEEEQESMLQRDFNLFVIGHIKEKIREIYKTENKGTPDFIKPDISYMQFSKMLKQMARKITDKFGFSMKFYDWKELN